MCSHAIGAASRVAVRAAAFGPLRQLGGVAETRRFDPFVSKESASTRFLLLATRRAPALTTQLRCPPIAARAARRAESPSCLCRVDTAGSGAQTRLRSSKASSAAIGTSHSRGLTCRRRTPSCEAKSRATGHRADALGGREAAEVPSVVCERADGLGHVHPASRGRRLMVQPAGRAQNAVWVPLAYSRDYARRGIEHCDGLDAPVRVVHGADLRGLRFRASC